MVFVMVVGTPVEKSHTAFGQIENLTVFFGVFSFVPTMTEPFRACLLSWNEPTCKWLSVGACRFVHHGVEAVEHRQAGGSCALARTP